VEEVAGAHRGKPMRRVWRIFGGWWALVLGAVAWAHDPGLSTAQGRVTATTIELTVGFAPADAEQLLPPEARVAGKWTQAEFVAAQPLLAGLAPEIMELRAGGAAVAPSTARVELAAGDALNFLLVYPRPPPGVVTLRAQKLGLLSPGHREFVLIVDERGATVEKKLLSAKDNTVQLDLGQVQSATAGAPAASGDAGASGDAPTFRGFIVLGVEHIWTGYDHLLFLFALLVVCRSFRSIVGIITCFTVAHSLTLALATFDIVNLPSRLVEAVIAASIVYVGVENLVRRGEEPKGRWALTFAFGLVHGFGFASVLKELGVGAGGSGLLMPLFTFNLGVELGQIVIAAVVLPIFWRCRKNEKFIKRGVPALSAVVALAGIYWLVERTILG
jgi:hydrogenase/urease accessory protein HupE